jgi:hypothetical protein
MVGKPNLSRDSHDLSGAARATPGLSALDQEREASMADEGGASGMVMESEDESAVPVVVHRVAPSRRKRLARGLVLGAAAGFVGAALWRTRFR